MTFINLALCLLLLLLCKRLFRSSYRFPTFVAPIFPLKFWQNLVEKFACPSPSPGVHHVWNLSRPPQALPRKKFWGPPKPPRRRYWGSKFQLPPSPLKFPSSKVGILPSRGRARFVMLKISETVYCGLGLDVSWVPYAFTRCPFQPRMGHIDQLAYALMIAANCSHYSPFIHYVAAPLCLWLQFCLWWPWCCCPLLL